MEEFESLRLRFLLEAEQVPLETGERIGISTRDLIALARVADAASTAVAERAAWSFVARLELPEGELATVMNRSARRSGRGLQHRGTDFAPGQLSRVENGSVELLVFVLGGLALRWASTNLFGEAVVEGWKESVGRERLKNAARGMFGGATEAVEEAAAERVPRSLTAREVKVEPAGEAGTAGGIVLRLGKKRSPELEAWDEREDLFVPGWRVVGREDPEWRIKGAPPKEKAERKARPPKERKQGA
ncbi:MAG TPA: hypothetical protein VF255_06990 [Solirubrobacterales bacterium]